MAAQEHDIAAAGIHKYVLFGVASAVGIPCIEFTYRTCLCSAAAHLKLQQTKAE